MELEVSVVAPGATSRPAGWLPLLACLAAADALRDSAGLPAEVGWPDVVLIPGAMCGGSAPSKRVAVARVEPIATGTCISVSLALRGSPTDITTSVASAGGRADAEELRASLLEHLDRRVRQWHVGDPGLGADYRARCQTVGRLADEGHWVSGIAADGSLELTGLGAPRQLLP